MRLLTPFPLEHAHALPVTGEHHPLRQEYRRWMSMGNAVTMLLVMAGACAYLATRRDPIVLDVHPPISLVDTLVAPPSIDKGKVTPAFTSVQPDFGSLVPVPDENPDLSEYPTQEQIGQMWGTSDIPALDPGSLVVPSEPALPGPGEFVVHEQEPQLLRMNAPEYPSLARETGVEGTVVLRVLVSKEGKVLNVIVLSGNPMLADAARTAAFTARFSPAQQQHKPVPVWVQLPVVFSLN